MERGSWNSRSAFILASIGSAVGLGNAWRFPGLVAKHGGGTFLLVYIVAMFIIGIPLLMMELSIGRKIKSGAPGALKALNKKYEVVGWAATANAFVISTYYAVVFAWVLIMAVFSFKFAGMTGDPKAASGLFASITETTWTVSDYGIPISILLALIVAWILIYVCIKDGAKSVSAIVKYTVFLPVIFLVIMAIVSLTDNGVVNAIFGCIFYLCLVTLAIDSAFSTVEGVSTAVSDKFKAPHKKVTKYVCMVSAVISLLYATRAGLAWLDIVDNWTNQYNMVIIGIIECIIVGWLFDPNKVLKEINKNTNVVKMPSWWFKLAIRFLAPLLLAVLLAVKLYNLFVVNGGSYGDYPMWAICIGGWVLTGLCFASGFFIKMIVKKKKVKGFQEDDRTWDEF